MLLSRRRRRRIGAPPGFYPADVTDWIYGMKETRSSETRASPPDVCFLDFQNKTRFLRDLVVLYSLHHFIFSNIVITIQMLCIITWQNVFMVCFIRLTLPKKTLFQSFNLGTSVWHSKGLTSMHWNSKYILVLSVKRIHNNFCSIYQ